MEKVQELDKTKDSLFKKDENNGNLGFTSYFKEFLSHLEELRGRIVKCILIIVLGTGICLFFSEQLIKLLTSHFLTDKEPFLALLYPTEGFVVRLKISFVTALFFTSPLWFLQIWGFLIPAFTKDSEKKFIKKVFYPAIFASSFMFVLGAVFGYRLLPFASQYFQALAPAGVEVYWSLAKYVDFSLRMIVAFALVFELPFVIYLAAFIGIVTPKQLRKYRRHAIIALFICSALITPPDVFTLIILAIPLIALYEFGILMAVFAQKKKNKSVSD